MKSVDYIHNMNKFKIGDMVSFTQALYAGDTTFEAKRIGTIIGVILIGFDKNEAAQYSYNVVEVLAAPCTNGKNFNPDPGLMREFNLNEIF
jgi:hypothetical protein